MQVYSFVDEKTRSATISVTDNASEKLEEIVKNWIKTACPDAKYEIYQLTADVFLIENTPGYIYGATLNKRVVNKFTAFLVKEMPQSLLNVESAVSNSSENELELLKSANKALEREIMRLLLVTKPQDTKECVNCLMLQAETESTRRIMNNDIDVKRKLNEEISSLKKENNTLKDVRAHFNENDARLLLKLLENANVETSNVEKSNVENTKVEKSNVEKSNVENTKVEKSNVEKSNVENTKVEKSNVEKSNVENTTNDQK